MPAWHARPLVNFISSSLSEILSNKPDPIFQLRTKGIATLLMNPGVNKLDVETNRKA